MYNYTVFYTKESYNPNKSYYQNQNRLAGSKSFKTLEDAKAFCETVKNGKIYYLGVRI